MGGWSETPQGYEDIVRQQAATAAAPDSNLVEVFKRMRQDARSDPKPTETAQTFTIAFTFDGATQTPLVGDRLIVPIGRHSGTLIGAEMVADAVAGCTIDVQLAQMGSWPTTSPIYDTMPSLTAPGAVEFNVTNWKQILQPFDVLSARLTSVSAPITTVTLSLIYRRNKWPNGSATLVDSGGNTLVNSAGNTLVQRN